jgi:hypothetical protein
MGSRILEIVQANLVESPAESGHGRVVAVNEDEPHEVKEVVGRFHV